MAFQLIILVDVSGVFLLGARLRGRTATQRSKTEKGSGGKGSQKGF